MAQDGIMPYATPLFYVKHIQKSTLQMTKKQFFAMLMLALSFAIQANAQSFLDGLRENKQGEGTVTVTQSKDIDELVNDAKLVRNTPTATKPQQGQTSSTQQKPDHNASEPKNETAKEPTHEQRHATKQSETKAETSTVNTNKKVMKGSRKVTGYRIQAYSGGNSRADRQKAESIGSAIKMRYPELPIYVHFYSPRWICRVGNFRTYQDANNVLKEIKGMGYKQACIVKGKIDVGY